MSIRDDRAEAEETINRILDTDPINYEELIKKLQQVEQEFEKVKTLNLEMEKMWRNKIQELKAKGPSFKV